MNDAQMEYQAALGTARHALEAREYDRSTSCRLAHCPEDCPIAEENRLSQTKIGNGLSSPKPEVEGSNPSCPAGPIALACAPLVAMTYCIAHGDDAGAHGDIHGSARARAGCAGDEHR